MGRVLRGLPGAGGLTVLALCAAAVLAAPAGAAGPTTCSGTVDSPGTVAGTIDGNLTVQPGAALIAAFGTTGSDVTVKGNVDVKNGGAAILGCNPESSPCFDDDPTNPTLTVTVAVAGNLTSSQALGVIVHNATVGGNVEQHGGGGGFTCDPSGVFA